MGSTLLSKRLSSAALQGGAASMKTSLLFPARPRRHFSAGVINWTAKAATPRRGPVQRQNVLVMQSRFRPLGAQCCRAFSSSPVSRHGHLDPPKPGEERKITFITKEGDSYTFDVADGDNLLDIAQANDLEMEGACGGSCACSTCHVVVEDQDYYDKMEEPDDDENDMLDLAFGLTETSRLGCQVKMSRHLDGLVVRLPSMTRNLQASDFADKS